MITIASNRSIASHTDITMSNQAVGAVYKAIIDDVVNSSRVDFEESGVEESVLEELRQVRYALSVQSFGLVRLAPFSGTAWVEQKKSSSSTKTSVCLFLLFSHNLNEHLKRKGLCLNALYRLSETRSSRWHLGQSGAQLIRIG